VDEVLPYFFDLDDLLTKAARHADEYRSASPFPHVVIDDLLRLAVATACAEEFPGPDDIPWDL